MPAGRPAVVWAGVRALSNKVASTADAEDATQETFLRGYAQLNTLRSTTALGRWLRQIAHHVCVDMVRRGRVRRHSDADVATVVSDPESSDVIDRDGREYIQALVQQLPDPLRETILLHYYQQMSYDEMAAWLGVARSTVNERLSKARALLKQKLPSAESNRDGM